ncbi:hypothetical protein PTTG_28532 [Puccinia triticina 1-1 BBBD Race 1]|uniref:Uncharacterized protein n=2 Tax=Puccinia triticina TaxID=208348 RepID=A0A180GAX0_PUCT1|nr:uncharacterized protein PtA15_10A292 [Puccinia triticina]OAV89815.1 hypothetical protein PTTG_28532 [Puccinia triticina 1-1 BBBD Race 1]WAQ88871.1 hypothetical protein PtA15_10A292 [Puccinia triticina]WAR58928.1 hypothetical protein PtB15_10B268 [Puccinia triticina]
MLLSVLLKLSLVLACSAAVSPAFKCGDPAMPWGTCANVLASEVWAIQAQPQAQHEFRCVRYPVYPGSKLIPGREPTKAQMCCKKEAYESTDKGVAINGKMNSLGKFGELCSLPTS